MTKYKLVAITLFTLPFAACGGSPAFKESTETSCSRETGAGGEVTRSTTSTREVDHDGAQTERYESTTTTTPPPPATTP